MKTRMLGDFQIVRTGFILKIKVIFYQEGAPLNNDCISSIFTNNSRRVSKHAVPPVSYLLRDKYLLLDATADKQGK